ncbi:MAG: DUF2071 domain-containing protein [Bacteroidetes bacterium]|nr:DUF2071 domain-containing protein [Bacteroidota bacterium]
MSDIFLKAEWRKLLIINYQVDREILQPYLPDKTEHDLRKGICYVSLIGFMFLNTRIKNIKIPFHVNFEEVNLRFYVRHWDTKTNEWKRGVVFIKEIVPRAALTLAANTLYGEHYETLPLSHQWLTGKDSITVEYSWEKSGKRNSIKIKTGTELTEIEKGSEEEFITEHYLGYTKLDNEKTSEYGVEHPRWKIYKTLGYEVNVDFEKIYGKQFGFLENEKPVCVFLAEGSEIRVRKGRKI